MMQLAERHTFQVLTKRPERMRAWVRERVWRRGGEVTPNVWLGTSVENQQAADERIPFLLDTPAAVRFLSCEPLLSFVNLAAAGMRSGKALRGGLDWVIVGGESGLRARQMEYEWVDVILSQCRALHIAPFVKQLGTVWARANKAKDHHGGDPPEWPEHLRIREFPVVKGVPV